MSKCLDRAIYEWGAGVAIAWSPIACHLLVASVSDKTATTESWAIDLVLVALTTAGLSVVTLLSRVARGVIALDRLPPHCIVVSALNLVAFLLAGVVYGEVMTHPELAGIIFPVSLLVGTTAMSLYFETLVIAAMSQVAELS